MNNYPLRSKKRTEGRVWDLTLDSDDEAAAKYSNKKSRKCKSKSTQPNKDDATSAMQPELVASSVITIALRLHQLMKKTLKICDRDTSCRAYN